MSLPVISYVAFGTVLLLPVIGSFQSRSLTSDLQMLLALFWIQVAVGIAQVVLAFQHINNAWTSNLFHLIEFCCFAWVLSLWQGKNSLRILLRRSILIFGVFWVVSKLSFEAIDQPPSATSFVAHVFYAIFSIQLLHEMSGVSNVKMLAFPRFWILAGLLVYSTGDLIFYGLRHSIDNLGIEATKIAWGFHWLVMILSNVLFTIGFLWKSQTGNSFTQSELAQ